MNELDREINLGKVTENDFKESVSITILRNIIEKNHKIKARTTEADKIPNLDGRVTIIDENHIERMFIEIQVKTLPKGYDLKEIYSYNCDTKVFNVVLARLTFNPVVLFLVDEEKEKVYWKLISYSYATSLNIENKKNKTINFSADDLFDEEKFINNIDNYWKSISEVIDKQDAYKNLISSNVEEWSTEYIEIQNQVDRLNYLFDNELIYIKKLFFKNVWKFGISYIKQSNSSAIGIYAIMYGKNDTLIKIFNPNNNYFRMIVNFKQNISLKNYIDNWIDEVKKEYYFKCSIDVQYLSKDILNEIVFDFLDNIAGLVKELEDETKRNTYYRDKEEIDVIVNIINGLEMFLEDIIKTYKTSSESQAVSLLYPTYKRTGKFIIFNKFLQFDEEEKKKLSKYIHRNNPNVPLKFFESGGDNIELALESIKELQNRNFKYVERVWSKKDIDSYLKDFSKKSHNIRCGFSQQDFKTNINHFLNIIANNYNEVFEKIHLDKKYYLNDCHNFELYNDSLIYKDYINKNNKFEIKIIKKMDIKNKKIITTIESSIESLFLLNTPLYEVVKLLIYIRNNERKWI